MKSLLLVLLALLSLSLPSVAEDAPQGFKLDQVVLYQPTGVLVDRVKDADLLGDYISQLRAICAKSLADTKTPETFHVVVAIRPGKQARVWFVSSTQATSSPQRQQLKKDLEAVVPCEIQAGPVAFAISGSLAGGDGKKPKDDKPPMPKEWEDAVKGKTEPVVLPDGILGQVWPDKK